MAEEEKELFQTSSLTARKQHASTQSEPEPETPTKRPISRRFNSNKSLFDTSTESSKMTMSFNQQDQEDESSRPQEDSRPELPPPEMISQQ